MRTQAALQIEQLDKVELAVLLLVLAVAAAFGFYQGFRRLWKARVTEDAPTARVRSAHQGYVELIGEAQPMRGEPIIGLGEKILIGEGALLSVEVVQHM